ncbi:hypothetical protein Salat_1076500 [Sesamum alatum]|uniref:Uncharacterized protein n=1 Tax=Sesamum alatum TaxID=300844 RepID=A0AAE2CSR7_9LAMI|nr:hypothetical protein Salat_1076500 [Sesamum alatum]
MALQTLFPVFAPPHLRPTIEIRFSRWNNANAHKFIRHERTQKELEDQIRFEKRFDSALTHIITTLHLLIPRHSNPPAPLLPLPSNPRKTAFSTPFEPISFY